MSVAHLTQSLRTIPDFPKPGIQFKDITPVLADPDLWREAVQLFVHHYRDVEISKVAAIEARGFLLGGAIALSLGVGLIPIRKAGKLPWKTLSATYALEYGSAELQIHQDAVIEGEHVLLVDDLLATGGTAAAAARMVEQLGGTLVAAAFLIELASLNGRAKLSQYDIFAPIVC